MGAATGDGVRRWLTSLPTGLRRAVIGLAVLVLYGLLYVGLVLSFAWLSGHPPEWTRPLGPMIGAALGSGLAARWRRRRMGSTERVREFRRAVRSRRLPDSADPDVWAPLLAGERRALRRSQAIALPLVGLAFTAAAISAAVLGLGAPGAAAMLLVGLALIAVLWLVSRRSAARLDHLVDQLSRN